MDRNRDEINKPSRYVLSKRLDRLFLELVNIHAFIVRVFKEAFVPPCPSFL